MWAVQFYLCFDTPDKDRLGIVQALRQPIKGFIHPSFNTIAGVIEETHFVQTEEQATGDFLRENLAIEIYKEELRAIIQRKRVESTVVFSMSPEEIAAFWHLSYEGFTAKGIAWADASAPLPEAMRHMTDQDGILIGANKTPNALHKVRLPHSGRNEHAIIIGKTGVGKSSLLHRMIHEDIQRGVGLCVIDPHGDLVSDVLQTSIPNERDEDVVVIDLGMKLPHPKDSKKMVRFPPVTCPRFMYQCE
jgi:hypothetical protein